MIAPARAARMTNAVSASYRSPSCGTRSSSERRMPRNPHCASRIGRPAHHAIARVEIALATRRWSGIDVPRRRRAPITRSADSSARRKPGRHAGSCCPSASTVNTASIRGMSVNAVANPVASADPLPRFAWCRSTWSAPLAVAALNVASVEPSSTTMMTASGQTWRTPSTTAAIVCAAW